MSNQTFAYITGLYIVIYLIKLCFYTHNYVEVMHSINDNNNNTASDNALHLKSGLATRD